MKCEPFEMNMFGDSEVKVKGAPTLWTLARILKRFGNLANFKFNSKLRHFIGQPQPTMKLYQDPL
jgi:hypothetical protein